MCHIGPTTTDKGRAAETLACEYLKREGILILEKNYRTPRGEIDIIAEEKGVLCFVEVRSLKSDYFGDPIETITQRKRNRMILAAHDFSFRRGCTTREIRFDVIGITFQPHILVRHIRNAFDVTGHY